MSSSWKTNSNGLFFYSGGGGGVNSFKLRLSCLRVGEQTPMGYFLLGGGVGETLSNCG